jgi:hypothetical protein
MERVEMERSSASRILSHQMIRSVGGMRPGIDELIRQIFSGRVRRSRQSVKCPHQRDFPRI